MAEEKQSRSIFRRDVLAWCCYDWANSGYTTLMITVFAVYLQRTVFDVEKSGSTGAVVWAWSVAFSMLAGALLSPVVGAIADTRGAKRVGLALAAFGGGGACMLMALLPPAQVVWVTGCFVLANLCLEISLTFYNGFLPEVADEQEMNDVSAAGMAWGYFGGGIALLIAMLLLNFGGQWGWGASSRLLRICIFGTGVWWVVFTLPTVWVLRDRPRVRQTSGLTAAFADAVGDVFGTLRQLPKFPTLALFLLGFLFYNDGLQTVISQSSTFALQELNFLDHELVAVILMVQLVAIPGAVIVGRVSNWLGQKQTLVLCLLVWVGLLGSAWFISTKPAYWVMAAGVAFVLGGTQSVSRAIMGVLTPKHQEARYFGFFNLSGKATSFMGTFVFGLIVAITGSSRLAIVNLLVFFVIGLLLVWRIDIQRGIRQRKLAEQQTVVPNSAR